MIAKDITALTGIRFFAAIWVVLYHFRDGLKPILILEPFIPLVDHGHLAVPLFFILSGFILSHTYFPVYGLKHHAGFVYKRFARLWPMHVAALLALMVYMAVIVLHSGHFEDDSGSFSWQYLPSEIVMMRNWFSKDLVWNYPAWSIHAEWFAYLLVFPVAFRLFRNMSNRVVLLSVIGALLAGQSLLPISEFPGMCAEILFLFLTGSALYRLRLVLSDFPGTWVATSGFVLLIITTSGIFTHSISFIYLAFALLIFGLSYEDGWLARLLSQRHVVYGGVISYSMYMTHAVVLKFVGAAYRKIGMHTQGLRIVEALLFIAMVLITASASYHLIEAPCNRALRRHSPFTPGAGRQLDSPARRRGELDRRA